MPASGSKPPAMIALVVVEQIVAQYPEAWVVLPPFDVMIKTRRDGY